MTKKTGNLTVLAGLLVGCSLALSPLLAAAWENPGEPTEEPNPADRVANADAAGEWALWGGSPGRNMVSDVKGINLDFDLREDKNVAWLATLGSQTYGNAIVSNGRVYVGTNNGASDSVSNYFSDWKQEDTKQVALVGGTVFTTAGDVIENGVLHFEKQSADGAESVVVSVKKSADEIPQDCKKVDVDGRTLYQSLFEGTAYRPKHPSKQDKGILLCFDAGNGHLLWQLTREKLESGRVNDWNLQGICSAPHVEGDRLYVVTNRCELMCLDAEGFHDGENDGEYQDEVDSEKWDADIVWSLDMIDELGVFPHNLATSSPVIYGDNVFLLTSNGVDEAHLELPSPRAPSFLAINKNSGEIVWEDNSPKKNILHGQWGSPAIGIVNGKAQVYFPGGDGWVYALDPETGEHIWKFDCNPKDTVWELGGAGSRNALIATPVFVDNSVIISVGQDPEHGEGIGHMWRIDATKTGDVSPELGDIGKPGKPNPQSGVIWHYGGIDEDGSITGEEGEEVFHRTMSTVSVADGAVYVADLGGYVHCVDLKTGKRNWIHDLLSGIWGSTMIADGKVFLGNEDGTLTVFEQNSKQAKVLKKFETKRFSSIYTTPTFVGDIMYLTDRTRLYAVKVK